MNKYVYKVIKGQTGLFNVLRRKLNTSWRLVAVFTSKHEAARWIYQEAMRTPL